VQVCVLISEVLEKKGAINADPSSSVVLDPLPVLSLADVIKYYEVSRYSRHLLRYALPNVDSCIAYWQINANLNIEEGEKTYTLGKVR